MEGFWIWIFIMIIVGISKLVEKAKQAGTDTSTHQPRPRPAHRARPTASQPRRIAQPPPVIRPPMLDLEEPIDPPPRPRQRQWTVDEDELRRFLGDVMGSKPEQAPAPYPPPTPATKPMAAVERRSEPPPAAKVKWSEETVEAPNRASQWASAMRDHNNLRNSIIAAEILGLPKALQNESQW
jgi:hypothetical protein